MYEELERKTIALEYCRRMNASDLDGVLALFADDITFEDPVGTPPVRGRAAVRERLGDAIRGRVHESPGQVVAAHDDRHIAIPVSVLIDDPNDPDGRRMRINIVSVCSFDDAGLINDVRAFWGRTDVSFVDRPAAADTKGAP